MKRVYKFNTSLADRAAFDEAIERYVATLLDPLTEQESREVDVEEAWDGFDVQTLYAYRDGASRFYVDDMKEAEARFRDVFKNEIKESEMEHLPKAHSQADVTYYEFLCVNPDCPSQLQQPWRKSTTRPTNRKCRDCGQPLHEARAQARGS